MDVRGVGVQLGLCWDFVGDIPGYRGRRQKETLNIKAISSTNRLLFVIPHAFQLIIYRYHIPRAIILISQVTHHDAVWT
jgi:hypothetical protein